MSRFLSIDLDPQGLFVVSGTARGGAAKVEHAVAWLPGDTHGPPPLTAETAKAIGEQLRERLKAAGISPAPALVAVGRDKIILKELRYPAVPPAEEPALVRFQALKEITENPDEVILDYSPLVGGVADPAAERRATAVVVRKDVYAAVQAMCAAAGLKLAAVTPRPFAIAAGLARTFAAGSAAPLESPDAAAAVLTLGPQGGEFTVVKAGQVAFTRSVPAQVLANEALLVAEVRRNLTVYGGQNPGQPARAVYVAEADDLLGGWANRLRAGLSVPVHAFDPVAGAAESVPPNLRGRYAGAAGLLAGRAAGLPINFAAPRQPRSDKDPNRRLYALAGTAAGLLLLAGGVLGFLAVSDADRQVSALQEEKAALEQSLAAVEPNQKVLAAADQWESRGVNLLDELYDLSARMSDRTLNKVPLGDQVRVTKVEGKANRPDSKTGKQDTQAVYTVQVAAKNREAAASLRTAIERDNTAGAKYYLGTKMSGGTVVPNTQFKEVYTIDTMVYHRPPTGYSRAPAFTPPRRDAILAAAAPAPKAADPAEDDGNE